MIQAALAGITCEQVQQTVTRVILDEDLLHDFARAAFTPHNALSGDLAQESPVLRHIAGCALCQGRVMAAVHSLLQSRQDEAERHLREHAPLHAALRWVSDSKPFHDGLAFRWPEIDALGMHLERLPWHESNHLLGLLLRDVLCFPAPLGPRVQFFREYLKSRISAAEDEAEQLAYAYLAGDAGRERAIVRAAQKAASSGPEELSDDAAELASTAWHDAAAGLERLGLPPDAVTASQVADLERFREAIASMLHEYSSNDLTTKVIAPLERRGWEISVYRPDASGTVMEVVAASDPTFAYSVHHPMTSSTPDIEVDVFRNQRAERVQGPDPRLNQYIFRRFNHARYKDRLFIPVTLIKARGATARCGWREVPGGWEPVVPDGAHGQRVGNLSLSRVKPANEDEIRRTLDFAGNEAAVIMHRTSLSGLCERLLAELMREFGASHGAIHVASDIQAIFEPSNPGAVRAAAVQAKLMGGVAEAPRSGGIGYEALLSNGCVHYRGAELAGRNERLLDQGINATWAAPLCRVDGRMIGVVYLHFEDEGGGANFERHARCIGWALGEALNVREHQLERAHILMQAKGFARPLNESVYERLTSMTEFVHNLLGCDHVSIRTTHPEERMAHAGRYIDEHHSELLFPALRKLTTPAGLTHWHGESLALDPRREFVSAEKVESVVILPLKDASGEVGCLIMDYRRSYDPAPDRRWLEQLATLLLAGVRVGIGSRDASDELIARTLNAIRDWSTISPPWERWQKGALGGGFMAGQWHQRFISPFPGSSRD